MWLWTFSGLELEYAHFLPAYGKSFYLCAAWINNFSISWFNALQLILDLFISDAWLFDWKPLKMDTYSRLFLTFFRATWLVRINFQEKKNACFFILAKILFHFAPYWHVGGQMYKTRMQTTIKPSSMKLAHVYVHSKWFVHDLDTFNMVTHLLLVRFTR